MDVEEGLDTGGIHREVVVDIGPDETAEELRARLVAAGTELLVDGLAEGLGTARPQEGEPTYAEKVRPEELEIDWSRTPKAIHDLVRVGGAWTTHAGKRLKIWRTTLTADGELELVEVQPEGKGRMAVRDWANGARWTPGDPLGT